MNYDSRAHWKNRFSDACETMCDLRRAIHDRRMAHCPQSNEFAILDRAYEQAAALIFQFHQKGRNND